MPLCDRVVPLAKEIGAVNCLVVRAGEIIGHNTDASGFVDSLRSGPGFEVAGRRGVLLGAGGAARAVWAGLERAGIGAIHLVARAPERAAWVGDAVHPWTEDVLDELLGGCDLLVDCTSAALDSAGEAALPAPIPLDRMSPRGIVVSLVYHREPALLTAARRSGLQALDGAGMLVHQGARAFELWTGQSASTDAMWQAFRKAVQLPT